MAVLDFISAGLIVVGFLFFLAGTVGLFRFPDLFTRLHALTKADVVGLGFVVVGLAVRSESLARGLELFVVWLLVMAASTTTAHLISGMALERGVEPWREEP